MSLTLGLNTALSGLMTSQRGLDVVSQNVVNLNTKGYNRKVMNPESRSLAGYGAGVQDGGVTRMVSEGLLKDIRKQQSSTGRLETQQNYYPRIDDLFGQVADQTSIAHRLNSLMTAFQSLSTQVNKPAAQWAAVQSAMDVADTVNTMTSQLQAMRVQADRDTEQTVNQVNTLLTSIHDLNQKIVKNGAIATGTSDLEDKRDQALTDLSKLVDIKYFYRTDNSLTVYTSSGQMLLDNQPQLLSYSAASTTESWMTAASGQFGKISVAGGTIDLGPELVDGKLKALLDLRDKTLPDLQANIDQVSAQMRDALNQVHNTGTSLPNVSYSYQGTRVFATQGDVVPNAADTAAQLVFGGTTIGPAGYTSLAISANATSPWRSNFTASAGTPFSAMTAGQTFSVANAEDSRNNGTYKVVSVNGGGASLTVEKVNPTQTMQLGGTDDVVVATFDTSGNQLTKATLNQIMQMDFTAPPNIPSPPYTAANVGSGRSLMDFTAKGDHGNWSIDEVSAHMEAWMRLQGYSNASANLDANGKMAITTGDPKVSLAFRDQSASADASAATDATIKFDVNGDGVGDQTVKGFSNFFGLNDLYVSDQTGWLQDSDVLPKDFTLGNNRDLALYDTTGKLGNSITLPKGSTLEQIAAAINAQSRTTESAALTNTSWNLTTPATISVSNPSGAVFSVTLPAGNHSLSEIAGMLTQGTITGQVVQEGGYSHLRLNDSTGQPLSVSINGGNISGSSLSLGQTLDMQQQQRVQASVIPEGSGYRLRLRQTAGEPLYLASSWDAQNTNLVSELGMEKAATGTAGGLSVRKDLQTAPEKISRGTMQWNADSGKYYLSEGDNSIITKMSDAMNAKNSIETAGSIYGGKYSFAEYGAATISTISQKVDDSKQANDYQVNLNASLEFQNSSYSGVNLDEEIMAMMSFQQAYSASAKVITTLQDMMETLTSMIR